MFKRFWVRIPVPITRWISCKNCIACLKRPKLNEKEAGDGPLKISSPSESRSGEAALAGVVDGGVVKVRGHGRVRHLCSNASQR